MDRFDEEVHESLVLSFLYHDGMFYISLNNNQLFHLLLLVPVSLGIQSMHRIIPLKIGLIFNIT